MLLVCDPTVIDGSWSFWRSWVLITPGFFYRVHRLVLTGCVSPSTVWSELPQTRPSLGKRYWAGWLLCANGMVCLHWSIRVSDSLVWSHSILRNHSVDLVQTTLYTRLPPQKRASGNEFSNVPRVFTPFDIEWCNSNSWTVKIVLSLSIRSE